MDAVVVPTWTVTDGVIGSATNEAGPTENGLAGAMEAPVLVTMAVTAPIESPGGTATRTITASVALGAMEASVVSALTGGRLLALVASTLTVIAERGMASSDSTTNTTVPDGVGAARVATTTMPAVTGGVMVAVLEGDGDADVAGVAELLAEWEVVESQPAASTSTAARTNARPAISGALN